MRFLFLFIVNALFTVTSLQAQKGYRVSIDLRKVENDRITVAIETPKIKSASATFHLPRIVPGTYAIHNYGAYISNFKAFDKAGKTLPVEHPDLNSWVIQEATRLYSVSYEVDDTWDTPEIKQDIFEPSGTNIHENEDFVMNTFGFVGYLEKLETKPYSIRIRKSTAMYGSSSLVASKKSSAEEDIFETNSYHALADAPLMYCAPDTAWLNVGKTRVLISAYWKGEKEVARALRNDIRAVLEAHTAYLGGKLPVSNYAFLVYFTSDENIGRFGALEHSHSCFTVLPAGLEPEQRSSIFKDVAAHEFLHILTPLNIHSHEIGNFDYINTKMSKHLWMYEGLTEYATHHSQLRAGVIDFPTYLERQATKITNSQTMFNDSLAFTELSLGALDKHRQQYQNVYEKGALIGLCLDVLLLDLSKGTYGTREMMRDLAKKYGTKKSFLDNALFDEIAAMTYPEVRTFFAKYVEQGQPLPLADTFRKLGVNYDPRVPKQEVQKQILFNMGLADDGVSLKIVSLENVTDLGKRLKFKTGDIVVSMNGAPFNLGTFQECFAKYEMESEAGDEVKFEVMRTENGEEKKIELKADLREETVYIVRALPNPEATPDQFKLRSAWLGKK